MDITEIRSSGILELYVMDQLSPAEKAEVEGYLITHPELKQDIHEIERSLEIFAMSASMPAPSGLKERIMNEIKSDQSSQSTDSSSVQKGSFGMWGFVAAIFGAGILMFSYLLWQKSNEVDLLEKELIAYKDSCEQSQQRLNEQLLILQQLTFPDNTILPFQATPTFASTDLYLHHNPITKRNFIQVRNLPALSADQSFQLWSLKGNQAPAPMDVFEIPANGLIEVQYIDGTETYAITIEPRGGQASPTLANLIGTVSVVGI